MGIPCSVPLASPGSIASRCPGMIRPRVTSEPRTLTTYSCDSMPSSSWMRTGGITIPRSPAIWRRIMLTRRSSEPPEPPSTSGTRPKPIASSSASTPTSDIGSSPAFGSAAWAALRAATSASVAPGMPLRTAQRDRAEDRGDQQERQLRQTGDQREQADRAGGRRAAPCAGRGSGGDVASRGRGRRRRG